LFRVTFWGATNHHAGGAPYSGEKALTGRHVQGQVLSLGFRAGTARSALYR